MARKEVDWEAVELRFRAGTESLRSIGASFKITEGAIRQRAKKESWSRDLQARVRDATNAVLLRKTATHNVRTEREVVAVEADLRSRVILAHRTDIAKARSLTLSLFLELEQQTGPDKAILAQFADAQVSLDGKALTKNAMERIRTAIARAESLPYRSATIKALTETMRVQIALERQAFGIDDRDPPDPHSADFTERLLNARARATKR